MIRTFKDPYKINLVITIVFFVSIAIAAYMLFRLPSKLMLSSDYALFTSTYMAIALAFLTGIVAVMRGLKYRRELIVYKDRKTDLTQEEQDAVGESKTTISLESVKTAIQNTKTEEDIIQSGLHAICKQLNVGQGAFYKNQQDDTKKFTELTAGYALSINESKKVKYDLGEGLIGQVASNGKLLYLDEVPEGYIKIISGLGSASPRYLLIAPAKFKDTIVGVIEIASFSAYQEDQRKFVEEAAQMIAERIQSKN